MVFKAVLSLLLAAGGGIVWGLASAGAQEDPNAQYIVLQSGELSSAGQAAAREIEVPVEVGALRLHFNLQAGGDLQWALVTPAGKPMALTDPNISVGESGARRTISIWDPRPGRWRIRLTGAGKYTLSVTAQGELYICCVQFWGTTGVYGMERMQPVRGARHQAQVYASGFNIETIGFDLIDEEGERISLVKFRQGDFSNPYNFTLLLETPGRPFRLRAQGRDMNGKRFQRIFPWMIYPQGPESVPVPNESASAGRQWVLPQEWNKEAIEGEFRVVRAQVDSFSDQLLTTEKGNPIGIRLKYTLRFPVAGSYSPQPQVYPERIGYGYTGALQMRVHKGAVEPAPEGLANPNQLFFGSRGTFRADTAYQFTVDLVPNYVAFNDARKSFCLMTKSYSQQGLRDRFDREIQGEQRYRYRISFMGTDLDGRTPTLTENLYVPRVWHLGLVREGVGECP
ncbi:MAG: hypothetical protein ACKVX9_09430 [Blastocatellia bacterium]